MMNKVDDVVEKNDTRKLAHNDENHADSHENAFLLHENLARTGKSTSAFKTISEVSEELGVQQHVLRFWETKFSQVRPLKRGGGRRYYRPEDVQLLHAIHNLLYTEGYTIKGVQKLLRDMGKKKVVDGVESVPASKTARENVVREPELLQETVKVTPLASLPEHIVQAPQEFIQMQAEIIQKKNALSDSQREALDELLNDLKQIRSLINK